MASSLARILSGSQFQHLKRAGFIDPIAHRNYLIQQDYYILRKSYSQIDSVHFLSEKYGLSYDTIWTATFRKRKLKPVPSGPVVSRSSE